MFNFAQLSPLDRSSTLNSATTHSMADSDAEARLRDILNKSPAGSPPPHLEGSSPPSFPRSASPIALKYPAVNVPEPSSESDVTKSHQVAPIRNYGGSFFKSFRGRSVWDADDDEFGNRKYTVKETKLEQPNITQTATVADVQLAQGVHPSATIHIDHSTRDTPGRASSSVVSRAKLVPRPGNRDENRADDVAVERRKYDSAKSKKSVLVQSNTPSPRVKNTRRVSWADQVANANTNASSIDVRGQQVTPDTKQAPQSLQDTESGISGSTLSLNSPFHSNLSLVPKSTRDAINYKTIKKSQGTKIKQQLNNYTLAAVRDISPFKGSIWDPEDDEWADVDARNVADTFRASYKDPGPYSSRKATALSRFGSSIQDTFGSLLSLSPTKKAADQKLRDEEQIRDRLEVLGNTYYCNAEGDLCDEIMQQVFLGGSRYIEMSISPRRMHVINLEAYFKAQDLLLQQAKPRLCDAVATVLSHTNRECIEAFLDPTIGEFVYRRELDRNKAGLILVVRRTGNQVIVSSRHIISLCQSLTYRQVGSYRNFGFTLQWTLYVKSLISSTGQWHEVYATLKPGYTTIVNGIPDWDNFMPGHAAQEPVSQPEHTVSEPSAQIPRRIELSSPKKKPAAADLSPEDTKFALYQSRLLARYLLQDIWVRFDGLWECRATWEADGDVTHVRLKRALVGFGDDEEEE